jgi:hypothetical protein
MNWEYIVLKVTAGMLDCDEPLQLGPNGGSVGSDNLNSTLNQLGSEGWEGFSSLFDGKGVITQILLKRQKK